MELTGVQFLLKQYTKNKGKITSSDVAKAKKIEKDYMSRSMLHGWRSALDPDIGSIDPNDFYNKTFNLK